MSAVCMECGKKRGFFTRHNYAGLNIKKAVDESNKHAFPNKYEELVLPGDPKKDFLCSECASKRSVKCNIHGIVSGKFSKGTPPVCLSCKDASANRRCIDCQNFFHVNTSRTGNVNTCAVFYFERDVDLRFVNLAPKCERFKPKPRVVKIGDQF